MSWVNLGILIFVFICSSLSKSNAHEVELRRETSQELSVCEHNAETAEEFPVASAYIRRLADRIIQNNPEVFNEDLEGSNICINLSKTRAQRAWAMADERNINIDGGILLRVQNDAQMAFTMAHELAHITMRHSPLEGNPFPVEVRQQASSLIIQKDRAFQRMLSAGKNDPNADRYRAKLNILEQLLFDLYAEHFSEEESANWMENEANQIGAYYYLNSGYPTVELAWRSEQIVLGLQTAGLDPINDMGGQGFDPHGPPSSRTSETREQDSLKACDLNSTESSEPPRGTHRYTKPCWQLWNLKRHLPTQDGLFSQLFSEAPSSYEELSSPSLSDVKAELCASVKTRIESYCE